MLLRSPSCAVMDSMDEGEEKGDQGNDSKDSTHGSFYGTDLGHVGASRAHFLSASFAGSSEHAIGQHWRYGLSEQLNQLQLKFFWGMMF